MEKLNLYALLPCPVKVAIEEAFNEYLERIEKEDGRKYNCLIEANANKNLAKKNFIDEYKEIDDIPDIIISAGINDFYGKYFYNKFIDTGLFESDISRDYNEFLGANKIKDPKSSYNIIAMNVLVMVVDLTRLGNVSVPTSFKDLLKDDFVKNIAIRGEKEKFCETTLLTIYKEYGMEGIKKLGKAVKYGWHPSQMVQNAGKALEDAPIVTIMPYFYTKTIQNKDKVKVIWPAEGAIISPITMLVKKQKAKELKKITDFFIGEEVGNIFANAKFPTLNPNVENSIPNEAKYNWIDWDFIKENDIKALVKELNKKFIEVYKEG